MSKVHLVSIVTPLPVEVELQDLNKYFAYIFWVKNADNTGHHFTILRHTKNHIYVLDSLNSQPIRLKKLAK